MAWRYKEEHSDDIYPRHIGEFCSNHHPDIPPPVRLWHESEKQARQRLANLGKKCRQGRPRPCKEFTTKEGEARGYVGLYINIEPNALSLSKAAEVCLTPPELMEPGQEHLYNIDGKPGITEPETVAS